jgi:hypothetical protein
MPIGIGLGIGITDQLGAAAPPDPTLALDLNFLSGTLDSRVTYSRTTGATYYDSAGVLRWAPHNMVRYSNTFSEGLWQVYQSAAKVGPGGVAPDGGAAYEIAFGATAANEIYQAQTTVIGAQYTYSIWVKAVSGSTTVRLKSYSGGANVYTANQVVTDAAWTRLTHTYTAGLTTGNVAISNNSSGNAGNVYIYGAQLESGPSASEYIATTSTAVSVPRFDHDPATLELRGLLLEEQRTNLSLRSQNFDNATWLKADATVTVPATGLDGAASAWQIEENAATAAHGVYQIYTKAASAIQYTASAFVKPVGRTYLYMTLDENSDNRAYAYFNLSGDGSLASAAGLWGNFTGASATITKVGAFYRVTLTATSNTATALRTLFFSSTASTSAHVTPIIPGISAVAYEIYGAQLEAGAFATSYIPTTSAAVTRAADSAEMTGASFSNWFNAVQGTFALDYLPTYATGGTFLSANNNTNAEKLNIFGDGTFQVTDGNVNVYQELVATPTLNALNKSALGYKLNDTVGATNGTAGTTDTACTMPTVDRLSIGRSAAATFLAARVHYQRLRFYNVRKTNAELQTLTT